MIGPRWLQAVMLLIAFLAAVTATPKLIVLEGSPLASGTGSPGDTGPLGHSMLVDLLRSMGYRIAYEVPRSLEGVDYLLIWLPGPRHCDEGLSSLIAGAVKAERGKGGVASIIVSSEDEECLKLISRIVGSAPGFSGAVINVDGLKAVAAEYPKGLYIAYTARPLSLIEGWTSFSRTVYPPGYTIGAEYYSEGLLVVLFSDSHLFTNALLGLNETRIMELAKYLTRLMAPDNSSSLIIIPARAYVSSIDELISRSPMALFHPGVLVAMITKYYTQLEESFIKFLGRVKWLLLFLVLSLGALAYMLIARSLERVLAYFSPPGPLTPIAVYGFTSIYELLRRGEISSKEAKRALQNLYEALDMVLERRLGAGVEEVLADDVKLSLLAARTGLDKDWLKGELTSLHRLYLKVSGKRRLPIVLRWRRALLHHIEGADRIFESIGVSLRELRGLEFELTR
ncbi:MAG: hypothetical protein ABWW69_02440 [Pyrodictiaceae archaeon]